MFFSYIRLLVLSLILFLPITTWADDCLNLTGDYLCKKKTGAQSWKITQEGEGKNQTYHITVSETKESLNQFQRTTSNDIVIDEETRREQRASCDTDWLRFAYLERSGVVTSQHQIYEFRLDEQGNLQAILWQAWPGTLEIMEHHPLSQFSCERQ